MASFGIWKFWNHGILESWNFEFWYPGTQQSKNPGTQGPRNSGAKEPRGKQYYGVYRGVVSVFVVLYFLSESTLFGFEIHFKEWKNYADAIFKCQNKKLKTLVNGNLHIAKFQLTSDFSFFAPSLFFVVNKKYWQIISAQGRVNLSLFTGFAPNERARCFKAFDFRLYMFLSEPIIIGIPVDTRSFEYFCITFEYRFFSYR